MACFGLGFLKDIIIAAIIICAIIAAIRVLVPMFLSGPYAWVGTLLNIVFGAVIAIIVVVVVFDAIGCLLGFPRIGHY